MRKYPTTSSTRFLTPLLLWAHHVSLLASAFSLRRSLPSPHTAHITSTAVDTWMPITSIHSINNSRCIQRRCIDDAKLRVIGVRDGATPSSIASTTALSMASKGDDDAENMDNDEQQNRNIDAKRKDDRAKDTSADDQEEENGEEEKKVVAAKKPPSTTRIGGRSTSASTPSSTSPRNSDSNNAAITKVLKIGLPLVLLFTLLKALLGGLFAPSPPPASNFVYYQSSMYESRMADADGNVRTTRKESMRSNIPSLMGAQNDGGGGSGAQIRRYLDRGGPDREVDKEIDSEVEESMREARNMMRGMGFTDFSSLDPYPKRLNRRLIGDDGTAITNDFERQIERDMRKSMKDLETFGSSMGMSMWDDLASSDGY